MEQNGVVVPCVTTLTIGGNLQFLVERGYRYVKRILAFVVEAVVVYLLVARLRRLVGGDCGGCCPLDDGEGLRHSPNDIF